MRLILVPVTLATLVGVASASATRFYLKDGKTPTEAKHYFENGQTTQRVGWSHDSPFRCRSM